MKEKPMIACFPTFPRIRPQYNPSQLAHRPIKNILQPYYIYIVCLCIDVCTTWMCVEEKKPLAVTGRRKLLTVNDKRGMMTRRRMCWTYASTCINMRQYALKCALLSHILVHSWVTVTDFR